MSTKNTAGNKESKMNNSIEISFQNVKLANTGAFYFAITKAVGSSVKVTAPMGGTYTFTNMVETSFGRASAPFTAAGVAAVVAAVKGVAAAKGTVATA